MEKLKAEIQRMQDRDDPTADVFEETELRVEGLPDGITVGFESDPTMCLNLSAHQAGALVFALHAAIHQHQRRLIEAYSTDQGENELSRRRDIVDLRECS